ncbi:MAG: methyltransferase [Myxococcota bacterium]
MPGSRIRSRRLGALRDRLLRDERFRRLAMRWPGLRTIARRRARHVFDLCAGFVYSQVLSAAVELGLFDALAEGPKSREALATAVGLAPDPLERLLGAAIALELVERRTGDVYGLGPIGAAIAGQPAVTAMIRHHARLYADLADPAALLRGERARSSTAQFWPYAGSEDPRGLAPERVAEYSRLMAATQPLIADQVLAAHRFAQHRSLLDVGGGEGAFLLAAAADAPALELGLFDLPSVAERAARRLEEVGRTRRCRIHSGDFFRDPLPTGYEAISLIRILHDHDEERVRTLLANVRAALAPGGTLIVAEPLAGTAGAEPVGDAYFAFYLLAMGSGRARSREALSRLVREAGFGDVRFPRTALPLQTSVLVARAR